jgi:hypothetical protein
LAHKDFQVQLGPKAILDKLALKAFLEQLDLLVAQLGPRAIRGILGLKV